MSRKYYEQWGGLERPIDVIFDKYGNMYVVDLDYLELVKKKIGFLELELFGKYFEYNKKRL